MKLKVFGMGNRIMMDDSIAIRVAVQLTGWLEEQGVEVVIGETDSEICFHQIKEADFLILMDATRFNLVPGTLTQQQLSKIKPRYKINSQHDMNLMDLLHRYGLKNKGVFIGIEVAVIGFGVDLSEELDTKFCLIVEKVRNLIKEILEEQKNA